MGCVLNLDGTICELIYLVAFVNNNKYKLTPKNKQQNMNKIGRFISALL
jgi:hypothetical protein